MINARKLKKLLSDLSHSDPSRRRNAAQELAAGDERAIYPLIQVLRDPSPGVQDAAMNALVSIGGETTAYMVLPLLREDSYLRNTALLILKGLGPTVVPLLYSLLKDKDDDIRKFALDLMAEIQEGVIPEYLLAVAGDKNPNVRAAAVQAIGALNYSEGVPIVINALEDEEWVAFTALEVLGKLGDDSSVDAIAGVLKGKSTALRAAALDTLGDIGSKHAREVLVDFVATATGEEKRMSLKNIVQAGVSPSLPGAGELLLQMFQDSDWDDKLIALRGMVDIEERKAIPLIIDEAGSLDISKPEDEEILPSIMAALRRFGCCPELIAVLEDPEIRYKGKMVAAEVAGQIRCEDAVPSLIELYRHAHRDVKRASIEALGKIDNPDARACVIGALSDEDGHIRKTSARYLGFKGDRDVFDTLMEHLQREEFPDVMEEMVKALLRIDPKGLFSRMSNLGSGVREAVGRFAEELDILLGLSRDTDLNVRLSAIASLGTLKDNQARARLVEATRDKNPEVRRAAVLAIGGGPGAVEEIKPLLTDEDMWVRLHAVRLLGQNMKEDLLQILRPMLNDMAPPVVLATVEAIAAIGGRDAFSLLNSLQHHKDEAVRDAVAEALARL